MAGRYASSFINDLYKKADVKTTVTYISNIRNYQ